LRPYSDLELDRVTQALVKPKCEVFKRWLKTQNSGYQRYGLTNEMGWLPYDSDIEVGRRFLGQTSCVTLARTAVELLESAYVEPSFLVRYLEPSLCDGHHRQFRNHTEDAESRLDVARQCLLGRNCASA
jgi:hypothetical protein